MRALLILMRQAVDMTRSAAIFVLMFWLAPPFAAVACPDDAVAPVARHELTGRNLWSPERFDVRAGGQYPLADCGRAGWGHVRQAPDFVFDLARMKRYRRLHLRSFAECDTVLLLRDPLGRWFFDDDSGVGRTASLSLPDPVDGAYAVWVGSFLSEGCLARLTLETF
jgi:hypothetical protein